MSNSDRNFKVWVVDFDGTLVDANFKLSSQVKDAIRNLIIEGYIFSIATGRPYQGIVKRICKDLGLTSPQIISGGSEIIDPKTEEVLWAEYFPKAQAENLIKYFLEQNFDFGIESEGYALTPKNIEKVEYGPDMVYKNFEDLNYEKVSKMVLFHVSSIGDPKEMEQILGDRYRDLHFVRSGKEGSPLVLDITSAKSTKHLAVLELSKILNIDPSLMVGVGDGYNDYPLLTACGFKVVMENAPQQLKDIADLIVPDVNNDGFVAAINKVANLRLRI